MSGLGSDPDSMILWIWIPDPDPGVRAMKKKCTGTFRTFFKYVQL
jgi:hypothetical protein